MKPRDGDLGLRRGTKDEFYQYVYNCWTDKAGWTRLEPLGYARLFMPGVPKIDIIFRDGKPVKTRRGS